jgi:hypothetical protein
VTQRGCEVAHPTRLQHLNARSRHFSAPHKSHTLEMPPKGKKGADKGKPGEEERDEPLQAVVRCEMRLRRKLC